jgi:hypothetical protein
VKRRKAIGSILLTGGAVALGFGGYEWFTLTKTPDIPYLLSKKELLTDLAETIIPATGTPGAKEAGVVEFMIPLLTECTDPKTLNVFIEGLQALEAHTAARYNKGFAQCTEKEREGILRHFEEKAQPVNRMLGRVKEKFLGGEFFDTLKQYSVEAYCISEKGATRALRYIPVPGRYEACIPLAPSQPAWATK